MLAVGVWKLWAEFKTFVAAHQPHLPTVVVSVVAALAILVVWHVASNRSSKEETFQAPLPPAEFLYLDGPKILSLLSELRGGEQGEVHQLTKEITELKAKAGSGPFEVGASSQKETAAETTITQNEASELGRLLDELRKNTKPGVAYHPVSIEDRSDLYDLHEGNLVRFTTNHLLSPGYIRPYLVVRQSATLSALVPKGLGEKAKEEKEDAEAFAHQIGQDPRLTFAVTPGTSKTRHLKLLLPMTYRGLTQERSLLEKGRDDYTGGRLTVMGEVIRVFPKASAVHCQEEDPCGSGPPEYTDWATREVWRSPLAHASSYLIRHVGHNCETPRTDVEAKAIRRRRSTTPAGPVGSLHGRECLLRKLQRQTEVFAPGAVIVPIAIYK